MKTIISKISETLPASNNDILNRLDKIDSAINHLVEAQSMQDRLISGIHQALKLFDERKAGTTKTIARIKSLSLYSEGVTNRE